MTTFVQMLVTALLAVTAENILFAGGIGFSHALRAGRRAKTLGLYSVFVTVFTLISMVAGYLLAPLIAGSETLTVLRPVILALCAAAAYIAASFVLKTFFSQFYRKYGKLLSPAAINTVVLSMPYVLKSFKLSLPDAVGFALGTGAAFFLAALVFSRTSASCRNADMPKAFSGLPAVLIYIGILSMAFAGFTGGKLF
ncbi:Rnf-Nqr domain containing protein [Caproiciproducens sp.]|uniref:Rnf-Nqr domain containing protein n=1 Tax=Caproiciproducens sp. TaxID=1954376 RepID=UPI0028A11C9E|nr:Rnf-Nqr domain containing protein [Caproiciproducens sp.]